MFDLLTKARMISNPMIDPDDPTNEKSWLKKIECSNPPKKPDIKKYLIIFGYFKIDSKYMDIDKNSNKLKYKCITFVWINW